MTRDKVLNICKWKIENIFIVTFCLLGLLYTIAIPPFRMTDEYRHFVRAYEVSQGDIISKQMTPEGIDPEIAGNTTIQMWKEQSGATLGDKWVEDASIPSSYSPFTYFTATLMLFIVRLFTDNLLVLVYAARIGQFIAVALLLYPAIKYIPAGKNLFLFFSMLPMCMQEFSVLSGDALVIALTIDVVAFVFYQRENANAGMTKREITAMILMAFFLGQCKYIYVFICLLYFFIPRERFGGMKRKLICATAVGSITGVTMLGWLLQTGSIGTDADGGSVAISYSFAEILVRTFLANYRLYIASAIADSFGDLDIHPNIFWTYLLILVLIYVGLLENKQRLKLTLQLRISMVGVAVLSVLALFWAFSAWTSPETGVINGLQGRYFIPIYFVGILGISLSNRRIKFPEIPHKWFVSGMALVNVCVVSSIFRCCLR